MSARLSCSRSLFVYGVLEEQFEKLSPPQYAGEIHARLAHSLDLKDDGVDKVGNLIQ